jgi:hypothetical protein
MLSPEKQSQKDARLNREKARSAQKAMEAQESFVKAMSQEHPLSFTKQELIFVYNVLLSKEYKLGDASIGIQIVNKIQPIVVQESNILPPKVTEEKITN